MASSKISGFPDGVTAVATDRIAAIRSPFGAGDDVYLTPAYIKDYILGLANTWTLAQDFADAGFTFGGQSGRTIFKGVTNGVHAIIIGADQSAGNFAVGQGGTVLTSSGGIYGFVDSIHMQGTLDLAIARDAANVLAQRNGTNAQTYRWYGNYVSSTDYHRGGASVAKTTLSNVSGASVTATSLIPDGAFLIGVTTKVTTAISGGGGTTGYQVGDGSDADRWGEATTITAGTSTDNTNATANPTGAFTAAQNVVITAVGGNFNGTGDIMVCAFYLIAQAD
jgi:hypothetical protein